MDLDEAADPAEEDEPKTPFFRGLWFLGIVAISLALLMKTFLVQAFFIPSGSMEKTLHGCDGCSGDRVLVNKVVYKFRDIHRGEIVVFNGKNTDFPSEHEPAPPKNMVQRVVREVQSFVGFGPSGERDFIKRVIGVPGDVISCCDEVTDPATGQVTSRLIINGQPIDEPYVYLTNPSEPQFEFGPEVVPPGRLFVMGDHRDGSADSRYHGTIPESSVVGRAFAVFFPMGRTKVLRVPGVFDPTKHVAPTTQPAAMPGSVPAELLSPPVLGLALAVPISALRRRRRRTTD